MIDLPPGWKFEPLHRNCPRCGFDLRKEFVATGQNKNSTDNIEGDTNEPSVTRMTPNNTDRNEPDLQWMICPLSDADTENAESNKGCWQDWKGFKQPRASKQKDDDTNNHKHLIPVVERKFGKRVIQ